MRYQSLRWSCGPGALVNAARALGRRISERRVCELAGTTAEDGTDEVGLMAAARELGLSAVPNVAVDAASAWAFVRASVLDGHPCLLCIDAWQHWVAAVGMIGDRVLIADPSNSKKNRAENGVHPLRRKDLLRRWRHRTAEQPFYAIAMGLRRSQVDS